MITKKLLAVVAFVSLTATAGFGQIDEFHLDETYPLDTNGTIWLQSDDAEVTIVGSDRQDVHVEIDYKLDIDGLKFDEVVPFDMKIQQENGNLTIKEQPREMDLTIIGDMDETYTIKIEAPKGAKLKLRGDDEQYVIQNIDGSIKIKADDADVTCTNCNGHLFAYRLDDGSVKMQSGKGTLKMNVDDGNIFITNGAFKKIKVKGDDGTFEIKNQAAAGGIYKFSIDDGNLDLRLNEASTRAKAINVGVRTDDGDIYIRTHLQANDHYRFKADDADIQFVAVSGGGVFYIHHDDADIESNGGYQILQNDEGFSKYRLNNGGATVKIKVDDADIALK